LSIFGFSLSHPIRLRTKIVVNKNCIVFMFVVFNQMNFNASWLRSICLVLKYGYRLNNKLRNTFKDHIRSFVT
jgi:hypothetical protein